MNQVMNIISSLFKPLTKIEIHENITTKIAMVVIYIIVVLTVIKILNKMTEQGFKIRNENKKSNKKHSKTLISLVQNVMKYIVWFIIITTISSKFGISVGGVVASADVVGLTVGFGAQTIVKGVITGFFTIFKSRFDVGDYIKINDGGTTVAEETVRSIGLRSTRISTISGELTVLPNSSMGEMTNYSITNGTAIVKIPVSVGENIDNVDKKLNKLFTSLYSKYYLFVSDPAVAGINATEDTRVILRISAGTIPGEGFTGVRIIRKEVQKMFLQGDVKTPQPIMTAYNHSENDV